MKTMKGDKVTVLGKELKLGDKAPDFTLTNNDLDVSKLADFTEEYLLISTVPSLDTGVCDLQTRTINEKLASNPKVKFITVSMDLPFGQKRWCGSAGVDLVTLSDHKTAEFGKAYGLLMEELRLLARSVMVFDKNRELIYVEYLKEMGNHPNYEALINFVEKL